ncbi:MAG: hypothetical protein IIZ40_01935 [Bacilli bacterium]|nr:hypothetical protein [Bacilli bacterium]
MNNKDRLKKYSKVFSESKDNIILVSAFKTKEQEQRFLEAREKNRGKGLKLSWENDNSKKLK